MRRQGAAPEQPMVERERVAGERAEEAQAPIGVGKPGRIFVRYQPVARAAASELVERVRRRRVVGEGALEPKPMHEVVVCEANREGRHAKQHPHANR